MIRATVAITAILRFKALVFLRLSTCSRVFDIYVHRWMDAIGKLNVNSKYKICQLTWFGFSTFSAAGSIFLCLLEILQGWRLLTRRSAGR